MVAGATNAELLSDLSLAVEKSIEQGTGLDQFRKDFRQIVEKHGWHGWTGEGTAKGEAWRTRIIYQTNMRTSYMAGRHAQLVAAKFKYWIYRHGGSAEPRPHHLALDGLILPPDHPFWATHYPPNGWGCSCRVFGSHSMRGAVAKGGKADKTLPEGWDSIDPKTQEPRGIDRGWGYAPGARLVEEVQQAAEKVAKVPPQIGAQYVDSLTGVIDQAWPKWLESVRRGEQFDATLIGRIDNALQGALAAHGLAPSSSEIMIGPNVIMGAKAARHQARGDALSDDDWLWLPQRLRQPKAVLLDNRSGQILFLLNGTERVPQLAVALDFKRRRDGTVNLVRSAYRPALIDIVGRLDGELLTLLLGKV
jgi:hypothetical protein